MVSIKTACLVFAALGATGCAMEKYMPPTEGETASITYSADGSIENGVVVSYDDDKCHHARFVGRLGQRQVPALFSSGRVGPATPWLTSRVAVPRHVTNFVSLTHVGFPYTTKCAVLFDFDAQPGKSYEVHFSYDQRKCYVRVGRRDDILGPEVAEPSAHTNSSMSCTFDKIMRE